MIFRKQRSNFEYWFWFFHCKIQQQIFNIQNVTCPNRWATEDINFNLLWNSWEFVIRISLFVKIYSEQLKPHNWLVDQDNFQRWNIGKRCLQYTAIFPRQIFTQSLLNANDQNINKNQDSCACAYCTGTFSAHIIKVHIAYGAPFESKRSLLCAKAMYFFRSGNYRIPMGTLVLL
jgi:hypothetical protein